MRTSLADFSYVGATRVANIRAEIDISNSELLEADLLELPGDAASRLIVSLSDCAYIDSSGLRVLIRLSNALGTRLAVVAKPGSHARRLIDVAGLTRAMSVHDTLDPALISLATGAHASVLP